MKKAPILPTFLAYTKYQLLLNICFYGKGGGPSSPGSIVALAFLAESMHKSNVVVRCHWHLFALHPQLICL
jgi:hypothetical protein